MQFIASGVEATPYTNANGVYQDGVLAYCRDAAGTLWALLGHANLGGISIWKGETLRNLEKQGVAQYNFALGRAGDAYEGTCYPDGPRARGVVWPCGLWIDPEDGTFYCFVHNETGWGAQDTSYTANAQEEGEPDFRHIGRMISRDQGKTWDFGGWIITSHEPCWTTRYAPDGMTGGQESPVCLGAGDFSLYTNEEDGYFYLFYSQSWIDLDGKSMRDAVYVARAPIARKGEAGSWEKFYNDAFCEPGNMGRESAILEGGDIASVVHVPALGVYVMSSYDRARWKAGVCTCLLSHSEDLVHWSAPCPLAEGRPDLSNPYFTLHVPDPGKAEIEVFMESNGTDVERFWVRAGA